MIKPVKGFSKLSKEAKIQWLVNNYTSDASSTMEMLEGYWHNQPEVQKLHDEFIENTISNYYMPFGVAPNFLINGKMYAIPLAIEESSVVAAAAKAAAKAVQGDWMVTQSLGSAWAASAGPR